jgi:hypothetical protein
MRKVSMDTKTAGLAGCLFAGFSCLGVMLQVAIYGAIAAAVVFAARWAWVAAS